MPPEANYDRQWHEQWEEGVPPGTKWDAGRISPMLDQLLSSGDLNVQGRRILVPGCGRGWDVFAFAAAGASLAVGLDLSPHAVAEAEAARASSPALAASPAAAAAAQFAAGDFFTFSHESGQFDVGYDYTFLCALHPDMRADWAASWSRLLAPGGELVTLVFPVGPSERPGAPADPPWQVTPELYKQLLLPAGFELQQLERIPDARSHPGRAGREWLGRWRRIDSSDSCTSRPPADNDNDSSVDAAAARL